MAKQPPAAAWPKMRIVELQIDAFKRLKAVRIRPDGSLVQITGKNRNGKSSVLDAIAAAIQGAAAAPAVPIHDGEEESRIKIDLGELVVRRVFRATEDGSGRTTTELTVTAADGRVLNKPQTVLDGLVGKIAFDPSLFEHAAPKAQFDMLKGLVPGIDFDANADARKEAFDKRTVSNRRQHEAEAAARAVKLPPGPVPVAESTEALVAEMDVAAKHNADLEARKARRSAAADEAEALMDQAEALRSQAAKLLKQAEDKEDQADAIQIRLDKAPALPAPIDIEPIRARAASIAENQRVHGLAVRRDELEAAARAAAKESEGHTATIKRLDAAKKKAIADADMPVKGLDLGDGVVMLNDLPFDQASDEERMTTSIAIAAALNPTLRIARIRDGNRYDGEQLAMLAKLAEKLDLQIWIERVTNGEKVGFALEDGELK